MKRQLSIFLLLISLVISISAQENESRKVNEFSSSVYCEEMIQTVDDFFVRLQENLQATGFIIYYEGKYAEKYNKNENPKMLLPRRGEAEFRVQVIRDHIKWRRYDSSRVLFINGGFREEHRIEFWLVPNDAELPKPTPTLDKIEYRKGNPKWACNEMF